MKNFTRHAFLWIALFMFSITGFSQTTVTIGTGTLTDRYPLGDYYVYQQSQMLFLSSEIGAAGTITHLRWYRNDVGANSPGGNIEIWLKETSATSVPDGTWETPGTLVSSITGIDLGPGDAWVEIDITDFTYSGTSNLLVSTYVQNAPYTSPHAYFRYTSTSPDYMMRRGQSDSSNPPSLFTSYNRPNIQFDVLSSGPENPASFTAVAASTVEIDLDWTQNISSDNVLVAWSSDGIFGTPVDGSTYTNGDLISGGGTVLYYGSALHYDHLGLTDNTQYFYRAWSYDGSVYSFGIIDDAMTPCAVISSLPFFEGFNSASTTQSCWTVLDENADGDAWDMDYTSNPYEGDQVAAITTDYNSGANDDYLISPAITLTGNERLKFWQRVQSSGEPNDFEVLLSTTGTAPADFTNTILPSASYSNTTYEEIIIDISAFTGNVFIAWRVAPGGLDGWRLYIDAVTVEEIPSCTEPNTLFADNIMITTADLNWTDGSPTPGTTFNIEYDVSGFIPTGSATTTSASTSVSISGLSSNTEYDFYVQANCGGGDLSPWVGPASFTTLCSVITSFPYFEGFEDDWVGDPAAPPCWVVLDNNADGDDWSQNTSTSYVNSGTKSAMIYTDFNTANDDWLISPAIDLGTLDDYRLKFWTRARSASEPEELQVLLSTTNTDIASFTNTLMASTPIDFTTYTEYILDLNAYSNTVYVAFVRNQAPADGYYLYLDDITVEEIPIIPICTLDPISTDFGTLIAGTSGPDQVYTITNTGGGTLTINAGGITLAGTNPGEFNLTDVNSYPINLGVAESTTVSVSFAPTSEGTKTADLNIVHNAPGSPSAASLTGNALPIGSLFESFEGTPFPPAGWSTDASTWTSSSTSFEGDRSAYNYDASAITDEKLITPLVAITSGDELKFYARNSSGSDESLQIRYSSDKATWLDIDAAITLTSTWTQYTIDLTSIAGADYYLAFGANSAGTYNYFYVDYVMGPVISPELPGPATIDAPADVAIDVDINSTLTWTHPTTGGIPEGYKLYFGVETPPTTIENGTTQTSPYTPASALAFSTTYYWQVVPFNSEGDATGCPIWSFTTMADPLILPPYTQDFAGTFPPLNYTRYTGLLAAPSVLTTTTIGWIQDDWRNVTSPVNKAAKLNIYGTVRNHWLMTPPIDLGLSGGYQLEFDLTLVDYNSSNPPDLTGTDDKFAVVISTDGGTTWTSANTLRLWDNAGSSFVYNDINTLGENIILDIGSYTGVVMLGFYGESTVSNADNDLMIDNLKVRVPPSCPEPTALITSNITTSSAQLDWTESGSATTWDIVVGAPGFDPEIDPSVYSTTYLCGDPCTYTYEIPATTLSSGTEYDWYIRADCGDTEIASIWAGPASFSTLPANDLCADAEVIDCNTVAVFGTTVGATIDDPGCGVTITAPGVWYKFTATGYDVVDLGMCTGFTTWDTKLSVFSGDCLNLVCVEYDDDGCDPGTQSTLTFQSEPGVDYYILVHGYLTNTGGFELTIDCTPTYLVSGTLKYANGAMTPLDNSNIDLYDDTPALLGSTTTSPLGYYEARLFAGNYSIEASTTKPREGTNILDAINTRQYLGGGYPMVALQQTAADVNSNANVDILDAIFMQQSLSGPQPAGWTAPDFVFSNPSFEVVDADLPNQDTWSLCSGDPNASHTPLYTCADPTGLGATNITHIAADLIWSSNSGLSNIEWGPAGFIPTAGTMVSGVTSPYSLGGLTESTSYDFYVQDDCSPYAVSGWVGPYNFTTTPPPPANDDCSGAIPITVDAYDTGCTSPTVTTNENATDSPNGTPACNSYSGGDIWYSLIAPADGEVNVIVNVNNWSTFAAAIYDDCGSTTEIDCGGVFGSGTFTLTGMTGGNTYYLRLWDYSNDDVGTCEFCLEELPPPPSAIIPPHTEPFDTFLPTDWTEASAGDPSTGPSSPGSGDWLGGTLLASGSAKVNLWNLGTEDWLISPEFDLSVGSYDAIFDVAVTNYNSTGPDVMGSDDQVQFLISNDGGSTWIVLATYNAASNLTELGQIETIDISAYAGTSVFFAFWADEGTVDDTEDYDFHIDNFKVE